MKKKIMVVILASFLLTSGCNWFIPSEIKRETSLMKLNIEVALEEIEEIKKSSNKTEKQKKEEIIEKAVRTLERGLPHAVNLDNYVHGRKSESTDER